jgi:glycosyltransferase involved in cell wall biosynthesis
MRHKTICFYIISDGIGGAENVVLNMIRHFQKEGVSIILILNDELFQFFHNEFPLIKILNLGKVFPSFVTLKSLSMKLRRFIDFSKMIVMTKTKIIVNFLAENDCELIHAHLMYDLYSSTLVKMTNPKVKLLYTVHGSLNLNENLPRYVFSHREFEKLINKCDHLVCVSEYLRELCRINNVNPAFGVSVISNGIDKEKILKSTEKIEKSTRKTVMFCGGDKPVKGGLILKDAISEMLRENKWQNVLFLIAGPVAIDSYWHDMSRRYKNNIKVAGFLKGEELYKCMKSSTLVVMPSISEGHPIIALEALFCATPVLVSDIDAFQSFFPAMYRFELCSNALFKLMEDALNDEKFNDQYLHSMASSNIPTWREVCKKYELAYELLN